LRQGVRTLSKGAILAAAVAAAFVANTVYAEDAGSTSTPTMVACLGVNSCKGKSFCKSFDHDCQGMNSCKGKGFVMMTDKECKTKGGKAIDPDQM
ncbi:MAG TPA: hypothetical protein VGR40_10555, partial [Candidatus Binatus sp.]|nr:hypothetical protein [Candidatus Binatus sp.]